MTKEELDAIAIRAPYCRSFGESVSLSRAERDELVPLARDGMLLSGAMKALGSARRALAAASARMPDFNSEYESIDAAIGEMEAAGRD